MANIGGDRPIRFCPLCKQADDHPRHVVVNESPDVARHLDCCRDAGCPDGTCNVVTDGAEGQTGADLLGHLTSLGDVSKSLSTHRKANPHQDPSHAAFGGFPDNNGSSINLQGVSA